MITIKKASAIDLQKINEVNRKCLSENYPMDSWKDLFDVAIIHTAVVNNEIVGYVVAIDADNLRTNEETNSLIEKYNRETVEIVSIAVLESHRNKKIGDSLLKSILTTISSKYMVVLNVRESNKHAQHVYLKNGFQIHDQKQIDYCENPVENALLMFKL